MYDFIIIGAGIVGLATGVKLLEKFPNSRLLIIEKEFTIAKHQTGNNSGVIHSGIYYKPGSLKALNCIKGYKMLLEFCDKYKINYDICGKLIVAGNKKETEILQMLYKRGIENGLDGIKLVNKEQLKEIEPNVTGEKGVFVPQTGIIDYTEVSKKYKGIIENAGGKFVFNCEVLDIKTIDNSVAVISKKTTYNTNYLITCCGLYSDIIAKKTNKKVNFRIIPFRGEYYSLLENKRNLIRNLIYPVPDPLFPFLGVHFTRMISGQVEAGPNAVLAFKKEGYKKTDFSFNDTFNIFVWKGFRKIIYKYWLTGFLEFYRSFNKNVFVKSLQKLVPEINSDCLTKGSSGIRAQACDEDGNLLDDFYFIENKNIIHVCNAPSPAATGSLAIGQYIVEKIEKIVFKNLGKN
ncbi:MAG: L-2-hydroxyglutarate oxidase [bacterium]